MNCPKCGAKMPKGGNICIKCGTKLSQIKNASNKQVDIVKQEYQPDKIVYSTIFPQDLNYTKTLLLCIFLGTFGAHHFYVKRKLAGAICLICWSIFIIFWAVISNIYGVQQGQVIPHFTDQNLYVISVFISIMGALIAAFWLLDILKIATHSYKVPVVLEQ